MISPDIPDAWVPYLTVGIVLFPALVSLVPAWFLYARRRYALGFFTGLAILFSVFAGLSMANDAWAADCAARGADAVSACEAGAALTLLTMLEMAAVDIAVVLTANLLLWLACKRRHGRVTT